MKVLLLYFILLTLGTPDWYLNVSKKKKFKPHSRAHYLTNSILILGNKEPINYLIHDIRSQVAQSVERWTVEVKIRGLKPAMGTWRWSLISTNQPNAKGSAPAATTSLNGCWLQISLNGINTVSQKPMPIFIHLKAMKSLSVKINLFSTDLFFILIWLSLF